MRVASVRCIGKFSRMGRHLGRLLPGDIVDPEGDTEVAKLWARDLWYFPKDIAMRSRRSAPSRAMRFLPLTMDRMGSTAHLILVTGRRLEWDAGAGIGMPKDAVAKMPPGEVYIRQGEVIGRQPQANATHVLIERGRIASASWPRHLGLALQMVPFTSRQHGNIRYQPRSRGWSPS